MESNDTATRDAYHIATALNELVPKVQPAKMRAISCLALKISHSSSQGQVPRTI